MDMNPTEPSEPNQKAIDAGAAALLRLPDDCQELAVATARQLAKDGGYDDWRECVSPACRLINRIRVRETWQKWQMERVP